jgi:hypothetical protein
LVAALWRFVLVEFRVSVGFAKRLHRDFYSILGRNRRSDKGAPSDLFVDAGTSLAAIFFLLQSSFFEQGMIDKPLESDARPHGFSGYQRHRRERRLQPNQLYFKTAAGEVTFIPGDPQRQHGRADIQGTDPKLLTIRRAGKRHEKQKDGNEPILDTGQRYVLPFSEFLQSYPGLATERATSSTSTLSTTCL